MVSLVLQKRLVHLFLFLATSAPFIFPIALPISVNQPTLDAYDAIEAMPEGSIAFLDWDFSTQSAPEVYPQALAFLKHAIRKELKFVIATFISPDSVLYAKQALASVDLSGYTYGEDYVHLGFFPGGDTSLASFARDVKGLVSEDAEGRPTADMPLMQQLNDANDFDIWLIGSYSPLPFVEQINAPYGSTLVVGCDSISYPGMITYYQSGQFQGLLNGVRGGAEYEKLLGYAGQANSIMNIQSFSHVYVIGLIIIGNALSLMRRKE